MSKAFFCTLVMAIFTSLILTGCGSDTCTLTTDVVPEGTGTVSRNPNKTSFAPGKKIKIMAAPADGYRFINWTVTPSGQAQFGDANSAVTTITLGANPNTTVTANFIKLHTLTVSQKPEAGGSVTPSSQIVDQGVPFAITAAPDSDYAFFNWTVTSGEAKITNARSASAEVTLSSDAVITANYHNVFTDIRDNKRYRTVRIGNKTWMAENLNFETGNSWCYNNNLSNCAKYGRLYTWDAAMRACPSGWRLPTRGDWNNLVSVAGGNVAGRRLKSRTPDWNGTDDFGFSALPGGSRFTDGGFSNVGSFGYWWSATEGGSGYAYYRGMGSGYEDVDENDNGKSSGFSVRCLQD